MPDILRFMTCGDVDGGKSTLIGRLLWDTQQVYEDHARALEKDSVRYGTQAGTVDLALILDGLEAEREQSITIDVAYRYFATSRRRFILADCPGHEEYTRNMATGASTSELAVLVLDAQKGIKLQTRRHVCIAEILGVRHLVLAVNKMDLVDWNETAFYEVVEPFRSFIADFSFESFKAIPVSALSGENVAVTGAASLWYSGPALLRYLEDIEVTRLSPSTSFRMAVQFVNRPSHDFRGYCGRISKGEIRAGDRVRIAPSGMESRVRALFRWNKAITSACSGDSVTLCLEDEIDISRGSVIAAANDPVEVSDQFEAKLLCMSEQEMVAGRTYLLQMHTCQAAAIITSIKYRIDVKSGCRLAAQSVALNDIAVVNISTDRLLPYEPYRESRRLGGFILVDRSTNQTVGAGMIEVALRRASSIHWEAMDIHKSARAAQKLQRPMCLWLTGLPASGKSTIANLLEKRLYASGKHTYVLDGDNVRHGLNRDLGFSEADRVENIRRATEVARLMVDAGLIVIVSFISPYRAERVYARSLFAPGEFIEVFVDAPLHVCERRDPKGLYAKARRGELLNVTGVDSAYEPPESPEVRLDTTNVSPEACVQRLLTAIELAREA